MFKPTKSSCGNSAINSCHIENAKSPLALRGISMMLKYFFGLSEYLAKKKPTCYLVTYTKVQQVCIAKYGDRKYFRNFSWGSQMNEELLKYSCTWNSLVVSWNKQLLFFRISFNWLFVSIEKPNVSSHVAVIISSNIQINLIFLWFILRGN